MRRRWHFQSEGYASLHNNDIARCDAKQICSDFHRFVASVNENGQVVGSMGAEWLGIPDLNQMVTDPLGAAGNHRLDILSCGKPDFSEGGFNQDGCNGPV